MDAPYTLILTPKWIKKGLALSKNPSEWRTCHNTTNSLKYKKRRIRRRRRVPIRRGKKRKIRWIRRNEKGEKKKKRITKRKDPKLYKKEKIKKVRAYGRTGTFWPQNIAGRTSEAAMGGEVARDLIFHSLRVPVERKKPLIVNIFGGRIRSSEAAMGGEARSALVNVAMSRKRRVRAAHGRARAAKSH